MKRVLVNVEVYTRRNGPVGLVCVRVNLENFGFYPNREQMPKCPISFKLCTIFILLSVVVKSLFTLHVVNNLTVGCYIS